MNKDVLCVKLTRLLCVSLVIFLLPIYAFAGSYGDLNSASAEVYKGMFAHKSPVAVEIASKNALSGTPNDVGKNLMYSYVYADPGKGTAKMGDFVRFSIERYRFGYSADLPKNPRNVKLNYTFTYFVNSSQNTEAEKAMKKVYKSLKLNKGSNYTKVKKIHDYLAKNTTYRGGTKNADFTMYGVLKNKKACCQGYALTFYRLCREAGIPCRCVTGKSKGENHMWNIVKLGNKWYNVDVTWDSKKGKKYTNTYFLKGSNWSKHTLANEYKTKDFTSKYPMSKKAYKK